MRQMLPGFIKIQRILQIHPEFRAGLEDSAQQDCGLRRHVPLAVDERVYPLYRNPHPVRQCHLAQTHRLQKFLEQNLSRMCRLAMLGNHSSTSQSMVIGNSHFTGISIFPTKNDSELVINPNAVLSS